MNSNRQPVFSVIIPTYNRAHVICRAIDSVLFQTYDIFELLIVDDGSKDKTEKIIKEYNDKRIVYLRHETNKGQNAALNTGLAHARGVYISFLDSDDEWLPVMLEKQLKKYQEDEKYGCVYSMCYTVDKSGQKLNGLNFNLEGSIYSQALEQGYVSSMISLSAKRACFEEIGNFDINFKNCQDDDICLRLAKKFSFGLIREQLAVIHYDGGMQVTSNNSEYALGWWKLFNKHKSDIVAYCGKKVLGNHYIKCGKLFLLSKNRNMAKQAAWESLQYNYTAKGFLLYIFSFLPASIFVNINKNFHSLKTTVYGRKSNS